MKELTQKLLQVHMIQSFFIIVASYLIYIIIKKIINKGVKKTAINNSTKGKRTTYTKLITNIIKYVFIIVTILLIMQINGIDVTSMIAGLGIVGVISGLAIQDALKDIIMGANIITDDFFVVGDVVKYNNIEGKIISLGLKTTKIQDIYTNNIISVTNRNIDKITNVSKWLDLDIPISYNEKTEKINKIFKNICKEIENNENIEKCEYLGINSFEESSIMYKIRIYCMPELKPTIKRMALGKIKENLDENDITIPYKQIDIHQI